MCGKRAKILRRMAYEQFPLGSTLCKFHNKDGHFAGYKWDGQRRKYQDLKKVWKAAQSA